MRRSLNTPLEAQVLEWLAGQRQIMIDQLRALVDTDSGSYDKEGVDRVGAQLRAFLETAGLSCETFSSERYGDGLRATLGVPDEQNRPILLMGTVTRSSRKERPSGVPSGSRAVAPMVQASPT